MAHLDLKPNNMVITEDFKLALIDFAHSGSYNAKKSEKLIGTT